MFNVRYNLLSLFQVILGLLSSLLLIRVFGVSSKADSYLIASNIMASLQFIQIMFVEQFMFFYNDLKINDRDSARDFYNTTITLSILSGVFFYLLYFVSIHPLIRLFAFNIDPERYLLLKNVLNIMFVGVIMESANMVNQRLLNAEMRFSIPYILGSLQTLFMVLLLAFLLVTKNTSIELIAFARTCGVFVAAVAGFFVVSRMGFPLRMRFHHPLLKPFVKNSLAMRFGHNIHNFLINPITSNILSALPSGFASYFYYAQRLQQIISNVVIGPSYAVFQARVSQLWSERNIDEIKHTIRKYLPSATALFTVCTAIAFFLIPDALNLVSSRSLQESDTRYIGFIFLALSCWQMLILLESPFVAVCVASKRSSIFILTNSIFIVTYFIATFVLVKRFEIYSLPFGAAIGQVTSLILYAGFCLKILKSNALPSLGPLMNNSALEGAGGIPSVADYGYASVPESGPAPASKSEADRPFVTIAIPTLDRLHYLRQTLESAISQTCCDIEILVSDNCSSDGTGDFLDQQNDPRLRVFHQRQRLDMIPHWNFLVAQARGSYLLLLSDDDLIEKDFVERCADSLGSLAGKESQISVIYGCYAIVGPDGNILSWRKDDCLAPLEDGGEFVVNWFSGRRPVAFCSTLYKTDELVRIGGFNEANRYAADVVARGRVGIAGRVLYVRDAVAYYRVHPFNATGRHFSVEDRLGYNLDISEQITEGLCNSELDTRIRKSGSKYAKSVLIHDLAQENTPVFEARRLIQFAVTYLKRFNLADLIFFDIVHYLKIRLREKKCVAPAGRNKRPLSTSIQ